MGYVDAETMIEFKDKIVGKLINRTVDKKVHCKWNIKTDLALENPLFYKARPYEEGSKYSIAVGQITKRSHYFTPVNGNGFRMEQNDYLHRRKKYLDYELSSPINHFRIIDLLDFLFGKDFLDNFSSYNFYPTTIRGEMFITRPVCAFQISIDASWQDVLDAFVDNPSAYINQYLLLFRGNEAGSGNFYRYKGDLFIVKDVYDRGRGGKFCKEVYGYLPLFISINEDDRPGVNQTHIFFSKLRK